ncbi:alpha/beta hydrolase fold domain-containing protein [Streptomyces sp. M19]
MAGWAPVRPRSACGERAGGPRYARDRHGPRSDLHRSLLGAAGRQRVRRPAPRPCPRPRRVAGRAHVRVRRPPRQELTAYWRTDRPARGPWSSCTAATGRWRRTGAAGRAGWRTGVRRLRRGLPPEQRRPWPAQREDTLAALRWIRLRAARFADAPARPVLFGSSAGGQVATAAAAYGAGARRVSGVVALSPPASPYRAWQDGGKPGRGPSSASCGARRGG